MAYPQLGILRDDGRAANLTAQRFCIVARGRGRRIFKFPSNASIRLANNSRRSCNSKHSVGS